jgi:flagellar hook assembly protein FlgD
VRITIFDAAGRRVRLLIDEKYEAGENSVEWDGTLDGGGAAASGVYFYRIEAGSLDEARKMVLLR